MQIEEYRTQLEAFSTDLSREHYLYFSGQKDRLELARIYDRYSDLYRAESIADLRRWQREASPLFPRTQQSLSKLLAFAVDNYLQMGTKEISEAIAEYEGQAQFDWQGKSVGFYEAFVMLANEPDPSQRRRLAQHSRDVIAQSNDRRGERLSRQHTLCAALGHSNYLDAYQSLRPVDYSSLARQMETFLSATDRLYTTRLREALAAEIHLPLEQAQRCDVGYFSRLSRFDRCFPQDALIDCYRVTMGGLGIDVAKQPGIALDIEPRPRKHPRAFCSPIRIPDEIKLVILPRGGTDDYAAFLHESGHAQHFGWTRRSLSIENKTCGDRAVSETYAFLFNYLVADRQWLSEILHFKEHDDFYRLQLLLKLHIIRRYAGKLRYELQLHTSTGPHTDMATTYAQLLTESSKFQYDATEYLYDLDDGFYSADYLRAWIFEAQLRDHLHSRFGRSWFKARKAGHFLIELWETGECYSVDELSAQIGLGPLDTGALLAEFQALS